MSPKPFTENDPPKYGDHYAPDCSCDWCTSERLLDATYHDEDPLNPARGIINGLVCMLVIFACLAGAIWIWTGVVQARMNQTQPQPIAAPQSHLKARHACGNHATKVKCRTALIHAYEALAWQKKIRREKEAPYGVQHALRLASALYSVPLRELKSVGSCESHLYPLAQNRTSTAAGLFQWLDSTWSRAGVPGFSVFDVYANAIATARLVKADGGWREWSCQP